jgi:hypothetical protein
MSRVIVFISALILSCVVLSARVELVGATKLDPRVCVRQRFMGRKTN